MYIKERLRTQSLLLHTAIVGTQIFYMVLWLAVVAVILALLPAELRGLMETLIAVFITGVVGIVISTMAYDLAFRVMREGENEAHGYHGALCYSQIRLPVDDLNEEKVGAEGILPQIVRDGLIYAAETQVKFAHDQEMEKADTLLRQIEEVKSYYKSAGNSGADVELKLYQTEASAYRGAYNKS